MAQRESISNMSKAPRAGRQCSLQELRNALRQFAVDRDWDQFHSPKNLAIALNVEAAELLEHFQWLSDAESAGIPTATQAKVREELADVFLYLIRLADKLEVDLTTAAAEKIQINAAKYPVEKARGSSKKYTDL
jgi:NTP pyrophosphatase (non-canonical NTP hydrolase)